MNFTFGTRRLARTVAAAAVAAATTLSATCAPAAHAAAVKPRVTSALHARIQGHDGGPTLNVHAVMRHASSTLTGTVSGNAIRTVSLQVRSGTKWVNIKNARSSHAGRNTSYKFTLPTSALGHHTYRADTDGVASPGRTLWVISKEPVAPTVRFTGVTCTPYGKDEWQATLHYTATGGIYGDSYQNSHPNTYGVMPPDVIVVGSGTRHWSSSMLINRSAANEKIEGLSFGINAEIDSLYDVANFTWQHRKFVGEEWSGTLNCHP